MPECRRLAAIAGVCGIVLWIPVIVLDRVINTVALLQATNLVAFWIASVLYQIFGVAIIIFFSGFVSQAIEWESDVLRNTAYLLMGVWTLSELLALGVYLHMALGLAALADFPLVVARALLYLLLGYAILVSKPQHDELGKWVGITAIMTGLAGLPAIIGAGWSDIASIALLAAGTRLFFRKELR